MVGLGGVKSNQGRLRAGRVFYIDEQGDIRTLTKGSK